jgi:hypothetical protein
MSHELDAELEERFSKTQEFSAPAQGAEPSMDEIIDRATERERELKAGISRSMESVLGGPVTVQKVSYIGDGKFEILVSVTRGMATEPHTVIVKESERKFQ